MSKESYRKWAKENPSANKERWSDWVKNNPEKARQRYKKWYEENKDHARKMKRERMREYRAANPEKYKEQSRKAKAKLKQKVFDMYGDICALCGFTDKRALTLDHIQNNGAAERKKIGERGVYYRAIEEYRPLEYRIICMNCQFISRVEFNNQNQW